MLDINNKDNPLIEPVAERHNSNEQESPVKHKKIINFLYYAKSLLPLLLAHHPECGDFKGHTLRIGKYSLCIGCFIGYPSAVIAIYVMFHLNVTQIIAPQGLLTLGIVLISTFFLSFLHLTKYKPIKIIQKIAIGIGAAFLFWYITTLQISRFAKLMTFYIVFGILLALLNGYHAYGFIKTCKKCNFLFNWGTCPGFNSIRMSFEKYGLYNLFSEMGSYSNTLMEKRIEKEKLNELKIKELI